MHRATLRFRPLVAETKPSEGVCEPGSDCARAAVARVRERLLAEAKGIIPYSLNRKKGAKQA